MSGRVGDLSPKQAETLAKVSTPSPPGAQGKGASGGVGRGGSSLDSLYPSLGLKGQVPQCPVASAPGTRTEGAGEDWHRFWALEEVVLAQD